MLDETEFLSDFGVRSLSKYHEQHPYVLRACRQRHSASTMCRANRDSRVFGGNSNWRGPIWMPVNFLLIESLHRFHSYYGDDFRVECPIGSGQSLASGRSRRRAGAPAVPAVPARRERAAPGLRRFAARAERPPLPRPSRCSTNISTATPAAVWARRTRPAGPGWSPCCFASARRVVRQPARRRGRPTSLPPAKASPGCSPGRRDHRELKNQG